MNYRSAMYRVLLLLCLPAAASAAEWQSLPAIQSAVESYAQGKVANQPGEYKVNAGRLDPRLKLGKCSQLEPFQAGGNRLWGNTSIGVRCLAPQPWVIYVPVHIQVTRPVLVAVRPLAAGQVVTADDMQLQTRDVTPYAASVLADIGQATGRTTIAPIAEGAVLRSELLRAGQIIRQGQLVKLVAQGTGFRVSSEGTAMGNATAGQVVSVKTRSGQLIKGIAKSEGVVEVYF